MGNVPSALPKGVYDGVIKWYGGDTFELSFTLSLTNANTDEPIIIGADDTITLTFTKYGEEIHKHIYTSVVGNTISLDIDSEISAKMPKGAYNYTITLNDGYTDTIVYENRIEVL